MYGSQETAMHKAAQNGEKCEKIPWNQDKNNTSFTKVIVFWFHGIFPNNSLNFLSNDNVNYVLIFHGIIFRILGNCQVSRF